MPRILLVLLLLAACGGPAPTTETPDTGISTIPDAGCRPESEEDLCYRLGAECGEVTERDRCGVSRTVDCGGCSAPNTCGGGVTPNVCGCRETALGFCARLGKSCGLVTGTDRCGKVQSFECGTCTGGLVCGANNVANVCGVGSCTPETDAELCTRLGAECGTVAAGDRCGVSRSVACGECQAPKTCATSPKPNVCVCAETDLAFCARLGKNCGQVSGADVCGKSRTVASCGSCPTAPKTCNANLCSCIPETDTAFCARLGWRCDTLVGTDNCGKQRTAACGSCSGAQVCSSTHACCTPETLAAHCAAVGATCGTKYWTDNCGLSRSGTCGSCSAPTVCSTLNSTCCTPETDAQACARLSLECGYKYVTDNCGQTRSVSCGDTCTAPEACGAAGTYNVCACKVTSGSYCASDAEVRDSRTGLIWERAPQSSFMAQGWSSAKNWCPNEVTTGGHYGWRLPTRAELLSIVDKSQGSPTVDKAVFGAVRASKYWTNELSSTNYAYVVDFSTGNLSTAQHNLGSVAHLVLCVRGP